MIEYTKEKYKELTNLGVIDPYARTQKKIRAKHFQYEVVHNKCACGCGKELTGRKIKWATKDCYSSLSHAFYIAKGYTTFIREALLEKQGKICVHCNNEWTDADHIIPVCKGGGGMGMWNFQGLCKECHQKKTKIDLSEPHVRKNRSKKINRKPKNKHNEFLNWVKDIIADSNISHRENVRRYLLADNLFKQGVAIRVVANKLNVSDAEAIRMGMLGDKMEHGDFPSL